MGLQQNLQNIQTNLLSAKTAIAQSISHKGVECSADEALSTYASKIDSITTGSTGGTGEKFVVPKGLKFGFSTVFDPTIFDTSQLTSMGKMFYGCSRLTSLDLSNWNTSNVTDMSNMFYDCSGLTSIDLSGWNTNSLIYMERMFVNCEKLSSLDLSSFNTENVTDMSGMFYENINLKSIDLSNFSLKSCTKMTDMFRFHTNLSNLKLPDLGHNQSCTNLDLSPCSKLTKDSILFLFNNAFDRATAGYTTTFTIKLNATTKALLSEDELSIATNKGFTVV